MHHFTVECSQIQQNWKLKTENIQKKKTKPKIKDIPKNVLKNQNNKKKCTEITDKPVGMVLVFTFHIPKTEITETEITEKNWFRYWYTSNTDQTDRYPPLI